MLNIGDFNRKDLIVLSITLNLNDNYPLDGVITCFEAYMFSTTQEHISEHISFDESIVIVDGNRSTNIISMNELNDRKNALTQFNKLAKQKIPSMPKSTGLSCCMIDFIDEDNVYDKTEINAAYGRLEELFIKWCHDNDRVGAMVQHFYQGNRVPHVHMLYQRGRGKHNEFQDYFSNNY